MVVEFSSEKNTQHVSATQVELRFEIGFGLNFRCVTGGVGDSNYVPVV